MKMADMFKSLLSRLRPQLALSKHPVNQVQFHASARLQLRVNQLRAQAEARFGPFLPRNKRAVAFLSEMSYYLFIFATWVPVLVAFNHYVGETTWIKGASMFPQFNPDIDETTEQDAVWTRKWRPLEGLRRGMVVELRSPLHPEAKVVKRVIGLEGDLVYTRSPYPFPTARVPAGHVWLEGDGSYHGKESLDSNTYGPVSMNLITGRVTRVLWPMKRAGRVLWWEWRPKTKIVKGKKKRVLVWS